MKAIFLPAYNRPNYLTEALKTLKFVDDWHIFVAIDKSDKTNEIVEICKFYEGKFASMTIGVNDPQKGMIQSTHDGISNLFDNYDTEYLVCIEDDLVFAPDFTLLHNFYLREYRGLPLTYGAYGSQCGNIKDAKPDTLTKGEYFFGHGWGVFKENWDTYFRENFLKTELGLKHFNAFGCDWNISGTFREYNVDMVAPTLARCKHMGVFGAHHNQKVYDRLCKHIVLNTKHIVKEWRFE